MSLTATGGPMLTWILGLLIPITFAVGTIFGATYRKLGDIIAARSVRDTDLHV